MKHELTKLFELQFVLDYPGIKRYLAVMLC